MIVNHFPITILLFSIQGHLCLHSLFLFSKIRKYVFSVISWYFHHFLWISFEKVWFNVCLSLWWKSNGDWEMKRQWYYCHCIQTLVNKNHINILFITLLDMWGKGSGLTSRISSSSMNFKVSNLVTIIPNGNWFPLNKLWYSN